MYWHKCANSGIWGYDTLIQARDIALSFAGQEEMYDVQIIDTQQQRVYPIKGDRHKSFIMEE